MHLKQFERAIEAFQQANSISRHDATYVQMGKVSGDILMDYSSLPDDAYLLLRFLYPRAVIPSLIHRGEACGRQ